MGIGIAIARGTGPLSAIAEVLTHLQNAHGWTVLVASLTLAAGIVSRKLAPKFPYTLSAIFTGIIVAAIINATQGAQAGLRMVESITASLPPLSFPDLSGDTLRQLAGIAIAVTVLSITEAISIARSVALRAGQQIDANQEFIGQGLSNIASSF